MLNKEIERAELQIEVLHLQKKNLCAESVNQELEQMLLVHKLKVAGIEVQVAKFPVEF